MLQQNEFKPKRNKNHLRVRFFGAQQKKTTTDQLKMKFKA